MEVSSLSPNFSSFTCWSWVLGIAEKLSLSSWMAALSCQRQVLCASVCLCFIGLSDLSWWWWFCRSCIFCTGRACFLPENWRASDGAADGPGRKVPSGWRDYLARSAAGFGFHFILSLFLNFKFCIRSFMLIGLYIWKLNCWTGFEVLLWVPGSSRKKPESMNSQFVCLASGNGLFSCPGLSVGCRLFDWGLATVRGGGGGG